MIRAVCWGLVDGWRVRLWPCVRWVLPSHEWAYSLGHSWGTAARHRLGQ